MTHCILSVILPVVLLESAIFTISQMNLLHSVIVMLRLFFHSAGVFVLLNAAFLASVQLIVYAGAILILYLFVVMLLNVDRESTAVRANRFWPWMAGFGAVIAAEVILLIARGTFPSEAGQQPMRLAGSGVKELGELLYQKYLVPFEVASIILLVGLVGAVMLAKKRASD